MRTRATSGSRLAPSSCRSPMSMTLLTAIRSEVVRHPNFFITIVCTLTDSHTNNFIFALSRTDLKLTRTERSQRCRPPQTKCAVESRCHTCHARRPRAHSHAPTASSNQIAENALHCQSQSHPRCAPPSLVDVWPPPGHTCMPRTRRTHHAMAQCASSRRGPCAPIKQQLTPWGRDAPS